MKWAKENYHHDLGNPYSLRLASGDSNGVIIVWDVSAGVAKAEFSEGTKPIQGERQNFFIGRLHSFQKMFVVHVLISII